MELKFNFPDYCIDCPLITLQVDNLSSLVTVKSSGKKVQKEVFTPELYCIHEIVCAMWQEILKNSKEQQTIE